MGDKREDTLAGLRRAKRYLEKPGGWIKGQYVNPDANNSYCLVGAFLVSMLEIGVIEESQYGDDLDGTYEALSNLSYIEEAFGNPEVVESETGYRDPVLFNDAFLRTKEEVLTYLDLRIAKLSQ